MMAQARPQVPGVAPGGASGGPGNRTPGRRIIMRARGIRGRRGDVILELEDGRVALPRNFVPKEWEWYTVEVVEDRGRYAIAYLHQHVPTAYGVCRLCGNIVDRKKFEEFGKQWLSNLLNYQRISEIKKMKEFVIGRLDALIEDLNEMIARLKKLQEPMQVPVELCAHGIDSCVAYWCGTQECAYLGYIIWSLEKVREELVQKRFALTRALDYNIVITTTPLSPAERVFV